MGPDSRDWFRFAFMKTDWYPSYGKHLLAYHDEGLHNAPRTSYPMIIHLATECSQDSKPRLNQLVRLAAWPENIEDVLRRPGRVRRDAWTDEWVPITGSDHR